MSKYQHLKFTTSFGDYEIIKNTDDNSFIPFDEGNSHYQEYLKWLEEGNQVEVVDNRDK